jgi:hypothetical protein
MRRTVQECRDVLAANVDSDQRGARIVLAAFAALGTAYSAPFSSDHRRIASHV